MNEELKTPSGDRGEIVIFQEAQGQPGLEVRLEQESVWLSLNQIAALFERDKSVISRHLGNVFREGELDRQAVVAFFATTAADGKTYQVEYFNLDAILSVGYRVNSKRGTQFRIWATRRPARSPAAGLLGQRAAPAGTETVAAHRRPGA